jgi:hypothetical protein
MKSKTLLLMFSLQVACTSDAAPTATSLNTVTPINSGEDTTVATPKVLTEAVISTKATLNMALIEADSKYHVWMQGRSGILRVEPANTFWYTAGGISLRQGKGQMHMEIDGHVFYTSKNISSESLASKLNNPPKNKSGYSISLEMTSKGKYITSLVPKDKSPVRIAASVQKPSRSAILTVDNPTKLWGEPTPELSGSEQSSLKNTGKPSKTDSIFKSPTLTKDELAASNSELQTIFGGTAKVGWSAKINLDGDEDIEHVVCSPTPKKNTCFVVDKVDKIKRYYETGFKWDGKQHPTIFKVGNNTYIHHSSPLVKGAVHKVLFFDGSGYNSIQL